MIIGILGHGVLLGIAVDLVLDLGLDDYFETKDEENDEYES